MTAIKCPRCASDIEVDDAQIGTEIECATCRLAIVVTPQPPPPAPALNVAQPARLKIDPPDVTWAMTFLAGGPIFVVLLACLRMGLAIQAGQSLRTDPGLLAFYLGVLLVSLGVAVVTIGAQVLNRLHAISRLLDEIRVGQERDRANR